MKHTEYVCKGGHDYPGCQFCDGGLFVCTICKGAEGSLPTDCPGKPMTEDQSDEVYAGRIDYFESRGWIMTKEATKDACRKVFNKQCRSSQYYPRPGEHCYCGLVCGHSGEHVCIMCGYAENEIEFGVGKTGR